jgi:type IV pilus assembly protein PilQ
MKVTGIYRSMRAWLWMLTSLLCALLATTAHAQTVLQEISFASLPGSRFEIALQFNGMPPSPEVFMLEAPARLTMDFANVRSELEERRFPLNFANAESVMILEAQGRTRMVVNMNQSVPHATRLQGNTLFVVIGDDTASQPAVTVAAAAAPAAANAQAAGAAGSGFTPVRSTGTDITGVDFRRGDDNAGQIVINVARAGLNANLTRADGRLLIEFRNAAMDRAQQVRLDVRDFGTSVNTVSAYNEDDRAVVVAEMSGEYEYLAYQANNQYIINIMAATATGGLPRMNDYSGQRMDLSFQNVEIRTVLQILAEFNNFSLVVGDNVTGTMTLHLVDVPWDQALDMVLRPRGLGSRLVGTVLFVAPADEIAQAELRELEATRQTEALAPLVTEYISVKYASAQNILMLIQGVGAGVPGQAGGAGAAGAGGLGGPAGMLNTGLLSTRGRASVDQRTNTVIIQDVQTIIDDIKRLLARIDVPVRQVLIEARIVNASTSFSKAIGIRWGGAQTFPMFGDQFIIGGSLESVIELQQGIAEYSSAIASAVAGGTSLQQALATTVLAGPSFPGALGVDLGVTSAGTSSIAIGYQGNKGLLELELSALEASGNGEVIAQPKVTTQDQQNARIESGLQIPYQAQAGGTAGGSTTEFVTAALSLDVTPQITPDGRIIMLLDIHQDSVVPGSGAVPAIATNSVMTRVLVNDGETIVLGGVFREEVTTAITKTPFLGDLPYVGNLFRRTENTETKTELLIFITPSIIKDIL